MQQTIQQTFQQTYRHFVQQQIVQREISIEKQAHTRAVAWEISGILALFSAAIACGALAQFHLG